MKKVICFGEVLWDLFPEARKPGGAPMNVAFHLAKLGAAPLLISAVGTDPDGEALIAFLEDNGLDTTYVDRLEQFPTGTVDVSLDGEGKAAYTINRPVAWDAIAYRETWDRIVPAADALVFGSLAGREQASWMTLQRLLTMAKLKIFDMNLRPPYADPVKLNVLLHHSDVLKINDEELVYLRKICGLGGTDPDVLSAISRLYAIPVICLTRGADGAGVWTPSGWISHPGYRINVKDTVGSGDAFLAAFIYGLLDGQPWELILKRSNAIGALVAGKNGASPAYSESEIQNLIAANF
ncbi:MAG TPA: carbohydrate kinase [Sphingobacteriaceae bacterium]